MRNIQSDGMAEDLIRGFVQVGCAETHMKTLVEKYTAQLENGLIDLTDARALQDQTEKIRMASEELNTLAELRRSIMLRLLNMYDGDRDYWCLVKHLGIGAYTLFEAYQASEDDPELYGLALDANRRFVNALTHFLGVEITDCAACFADLLKANRNRDFPEQTKPMGTQKGDGLE